MDKETSRNLIIAIALSVGIMIAFQWLFPSPKSPTSASAPVSAPSGTTTAPPPASIPGTNVPGANSVPSPIAGSPSTAGGSTPPATALSRQEALAATTRVTITSPAIQGSIALKGGRIDDIVLRNYRETVAANSPNIVLLQPPQTIGAYYAQFGWTGETGVKVPDADTVWTASGTTLSPQTPVTLSWNNGAGLTFERTFHLDDHYMVTIEQTVRNQTDKAITLYPYAFITRSGRPQLLGFYILHEGLLGVFDDALREVKYADVEKTERIDATSQKGGWIGITDKYWLVALIPDQTTPFKARFIHSKSTTDNYQVDYLGPQLSVAPGTEVTSSGRLFAGAKEVKLLSHYSDTLGISRFDYAVDWGWFFFLTKPIFLALNWLHSLLGNFGLAILALTVIIKLLFFPLANKSYRSMSAMKKLQPEMAVIRERCGDDRTKMNQEMMALYKRERVNPVSGCLPILIQIPVFFALYKVLFVTIEMRQAPFYGWIKDLSTPDPTNVFTLFGLIPWAPPSYLWLGAWPLIMGFTMWAQQKLNPQPPDPVQAKVFAFMPIIFTFMLAHFPAGLVIYWAWNNLLSIVQQWTIMRAAGVKP
ncbi:MAG: membrane protein insertase YidC [Alphaproteobacteria bacterium]